MKQKTYWILLCILIIGALLRFYRLGDVPVGFHRDEASLGYNAYALYKTGRDMSGQPWPLHLSSFLYSPAGYAYAAIPPIAFFGLNPMAVRLPSAVFGVLTVGVMFFLGRELTREEKYQKNGALLAALLFALSPWHINLSRTATENTVAVFFLVLGTYLFIVWTKAKKQLMLIAAMFSFAIPLGFYQAPRSFLPLFIPLLFFSFRKNVSSLRLPIILSTSLIIIPLAFILSSPRLSLRLGTVSIFATQETQLTIDEQIREDGTRGVAPLFSRGFHNKFTAYSLTFLKNYFAHFTYDFFFTDKGFPDRYRVSGVGLLYLVELPFLLVGLFIVLRRRIFEKTLILGWILLSFVGSALTFDDVPNLQRTLMAIPAISILTAWGVLTVALWPKSSIVRKALLLFLTLAYAANITYYTHGYYVHQMVHRPWYRHEGYKELVTQVNKLLPKYQKAIITNRESAPTIFFLFFSTYDPSSFVAQTHGRTTDQSIDRIDFDHYEFTLEECPLKIETKTEERTGTIRKLFTGKPNILYVNWGGCKLPESGVRLLEEIKRGDGTVVFQIADVTTP